MSKTYDSFKNSRWFAFLVGLVAVVFGIIMILNPGLRMESVAVYIGLIMLAYGVLELISAFVAREDRFLLFARLLVGVILTVLAILVFVNKELVGKYLPALVGLIMVVNAFSGLYRAVVLKKGGVKSWWIEALVSVVILALGIVFISMPGVIGAVFGILTGLSLVGFGINNLISFVQFKE